MSCYSLRTFLRFGDLFGLSRSVQPHGLLGRMLVERTEVLERLFVVDRPGCISV